MNIYAIIPARSGSKGLPDKNIKKINDRVLIDYSIQFAKKIPSVTRVFCSTDSEKYAVIARSCGAEVPFLRSEKAASDSSMEQHILSDLREKFSLAGISEPDIVVWLRPTFVFRDLENVEKCIEILVNNPLVSASRTVVSAENRLYCLNENKLLPNFDDNGASMIRRQDIERSYKVFSTDVIRFKDNHFGDDFLGRNVRAVITNPVCGMDIDDQFDFELVKLLVENSRELVNDYLS
ncbi:acylneuraminate cytidylyltransferase family protein [Pseudomonadales bacterium]|nr:acylneuraminate cytidylyltransferase family protein [Pseudomonadales bacterium]